MNRTTLISIGIIIILAIAGVWIYLMIFGTPDTADEIYTNLGFSPTNQSVTIVPTTENGTSTETNTLVNTNGQALSQLTTRPVAGFTTVTVASSSKVRYMERGTGHIFDIDLDSGEETRISPNTIPQVSEAKFNGSGDRVAIIIHQNYSSNLAIGTLAAGELETTQISNNAENVKFLNETTLAYTESVNGITTGYHYNTGTATREAVFQFAFSELTVWWGDDTHNTHLLSKPAADLPTYSYELTSAGLTAALPTRRGMSGFTDFNRHIITYTTQNEYVSNSIDAETGTATNLPLLTLSEKCTFDTINSDFMWCGAPAAAVDSAYVSDWYKGVVVSDDYLWLISLNTQSAELVADPETVSGRNIDITHIQGNQQDSDLFFINRTDRTLWRYNILAE